MEIDMLPFDSGLVFILRGVMYIPYKIVKRITQTDTVGNGILQVKITNGVAIPLIFLQEKKRQPKMKKDLPKNNGGDFFQSSFFK